MAITLVTGFATDIGQTREHNEDAILTRVSEKGISLSLVCDGIGGLDCGELAACFVAEAAEEWFVSQDEWYHPELSTPEVMFAHFLDAAEDWNHRLCELITSRGIRMGTTLTALFTVGERAMRLNIGDSRIYRHSEVDGLRQLTTDAVITRVEDGQLKSFLANYVGKSRELVCTREEGRLTPGEMYYVCSDGFFKRFTGEDAAEIRRRFAVETDFKSTKTAAECLSALCREWVEKLISRGESDNISVVLVAVCEPIKETKRRFFKR